MTRTLPRTLGSRAGAARVNIAWLIASTFLFFLALGFGYLGHADAAKAKEEAEQARAAELAANERAKADAELIAALSSKVGFYDPAAGAPRTTTDAVTAGLEDLRGTFSDLGPDIDDLSKALPVIKAAYAARGQEIETLKAAIDTLKSEKTTMEQSLRDVVAQKDAENAKLLKQIADDSANAAQRQAEFESRIAALTSQRDDLDAELRQRRAEIADLERKHAEARQTWQTRTQAVTQTLRFLEEPEKPDAEILAVSKDLGLGWIDIGAEQRLAVGTRFSVVSGKLGSEAVKASVEVTKVNPTSAEVRFVEVKDPFDPVVPGDRVFNPLYDPVGERHAVLAGRFTGQYDESKLRVLLKNMGITVQDKLDVNTDYLILGSDMWTDEEGNPLEEPMSPTELPIYKDAEANGVQIVSIKTLSSYFVF